MRRTVFLKTLLAFALVLMSGNVWADSWKKASIDELTKNDLFVFVATTSDGSNFALTSANGQSAAPTAVSVTLDGDIITSSITDELKWSVELYDKKYYIFHPNGDLSRHLYSTSSNNGIRVGGSDNYIFELITADGDAKGYFMQRDLGRYLGVYEKKDWRSYTTLHNNIKGQTFSFYKLTNDAGDQSVATTVTIDDSELTNKDLKNGATAGKLKAIVSTTNGAVSGATVVWTSSDESVATISDAGVITLVAVGTSAIKASYAGVEGQFKPSSASYTLTVTNSESNVPGTLDKPYTVAEARAAIEAGTGVTGVYATGIVSEIVTAFNAQYGNISYNISADGTKTADQLQAYRGKDKDGVAFTSPDDVQVGDVVVIYGNLKKYNDIYEFAQDNQRVSFTRAAVAVEKPTFNPDSGTYEEEVEVSISCVTQGVDIYYTLDGTEPTQGSTKYTTPIVLTETTTVKAIAYKGTDASAVAEATYTFLSEKTIAQVRAQGTGSVMTKGIVTSVSGKTAYIQDRTAAIAVYGSSNLTCAVGDEISVEGTLTTYRGLMEIGSPTITVISSGNNVAPVEKTIAEINADFSGSNALQGMLVKIVDATVTAIEGQNTSIAQDANTVVVRGITGVAVNDVITIVGNIGCFDVPQIANPTLVDETPSIAVTPAEAMVDAEGGTVELDVVLKNIEETAVVGVKYFDAEGSTEAQCAWIRTEYKDGGVTLTVDANEGDARTAYLKVYAGDVYSNLITISQKKYVVFIDYATLPFEFNGKFADIEETIGLTQSGLATKDYSSAPYLKFDTTGDNLVLKINEAPHALVFDIKANPGNDPWSGTFTVETSVDGEKFERLDSYTDLSEGVEAKYYRLGSTVRYIKWTYTEKVSGNVGLGNIVVSADPMTFVKVVTSYKFATLCLPFNAKAPENVEVYTAEAEESDDVAILTKVEDGIIPANTGVVLYANVVGEKTFTFSETDQASTTDFRNNSLKGVTGKTAYKKVEGYDVEKSYYALAAVENEAKFCLVEGGSYAANTAYLELPAGSSNSIGLRFGDATMVGAPEAIAGQKVIYDLTGRRVEMATKGIYIVNGRKVIVK